MTSTAIRLYRYSSVVTFYTHVNCRSVSYMRLDQGWKTWFLRLWFFLMVFLKTIGFPPLDWINWSWGLGRGIPLPNGGKVWGVECTPSPENIWSLAMEWCILRAFWHMIRQFTTPVLIRLKPAKSSDIVTKPCKVVVILGIRNLIMTSANYFDY